MRWNKISSLAGAGFLKSADDERSTCDDERSTCDDEVGEDEEEEKKDEDGA